MTLFAKLASYCAAGPRRLITSSQVVSTVGYLEVNRFSAFKNINNMPAKRKPAATKAREAVEMPDSTENDIEDEPPVKKNGRGKAAKPKKTVEKTEPEDVQIDNPPAVRQRRQAAISAELKNQQEATESRTTAPAKRRPTKVKEPKNKEDDTEETEQDEKPAPTRKRPATKEPKKKEDAEKPAKAKKETKPKATKKAKEAEKPTENGDAEKPAKAKGRPAKPKADAGTSKEPKEKSVTAPLNQTETSWEDADFDCQKTNKKGEKYNTKIVSWNVDGLRAWIKKGSHKIMEHAEPDIICLQETKCNEEQVPKELLDQLEGYHCYWQGSEKDGYAGVAVFSKTEPLSVSYGTDDSSFDDEGRCITAEYNGFYLVGVYVPNAGRKLVTLDKRLEWNESFKTYIKGLDEKKPVIVCGDMNVAHSEIDLANPKTNTKNAGFTKEEREGMTDFLENGFIDSYRELYPNKEKVYTFWTYMSKARTNNVGWRLDYFLVSERIMEKVCDNVVNNNVFGSDHCPITLFINI